MPQDSFFIPFKTEVQHITLPERFNYPFCYTPHPVAVAAAEELMEYIKSLSDHDFGLSDDGTGLGKMFGVLVVKDSKGDLGYLAAFSGKLSGGNFYPGFVPPVFDMLDENGFYRIGEEAINKINRKITTLEMDVNYLSKQHELLKAKNEASTELNMLKSQFADAKNQRQRIREALHLLSEAEQTKKLEQMEHESIRHHYTLKDRKKYWKNIIDQLGKNLISFESEICQWKEQRRKMSAELQKRLFDEYIFFNIDGQRKNLIDIFDITDDKTPPSGAGECAAPKLLQYAFLHGYQPITMAEFWWGRSPSSEIRKHRHYYPACNSKCKPILAHMLSGMLTEPNPMLSHHNWHPQLPVLLEDDDMLIINKPHDFLSVPGKEDLESVFSIVKEKYPEATGPLLVHRLDMSTSGILMIAKNTASYHDLQEQFTHRKVTKRYIAILDGIISENSGSIDLPLRVDLDDRPRQLVCYEHGKPASTKWKVINRQNNETRIYFYPLTGRTHQLRVHAAHQSGLNTPIKGDDLYGTREKRLYLHADQITFTHPVRKKLMTIHCPADF